MLRYLLFSLMVGVVHFLLIFPVTKMQRFMLRGILEWLVQRLFVICRLKDIQILLHVHQWN